MQLTLREQLRLVHHLLGGLRLLARRVHAEPQDAPGQLVEGYAFGFPDRDFDRLEEFADDVALDAIACGHIHVGGQRSWTVARRTECSAPVKPAASTVRSPHS